MNNGLLHPNSALRLLLSKNYSNQLVRLIFDIAHLMKVRGRTGIEFVLVVIGLRRELARLIMFSGAGLFILGGEYGFPMEDLFLPSIGSRNEHVTRRCGSGGLVAGLACFGAASFICYSSSIRKTW
ncbi:hypothetical protein HBI42_081210 [Parastagonospora nodorum]|nr:hypothetical protein HBI43_086470 [Parastagonospora nodorum]KAH6261879.1 hypothetical protein HBI42_081210 [Parastagonospora nodorum]